MQEFDYVLLASIESIANTSIALMRSFVWYFQLYLSSAHDDLMFLSLAELYLQPLPPFDTPTTYALAYSASTILNMPKNDSLIPSNSFTSGFCGSPADRRR